MRKVLLAGASLLALAAGASSAEATVIGYTGSSTTFTVPTTGTYDIVAFGAQGGGAAGGLGAEIGGAFSLTAGEVLTIDVGGQGATGALKGAYGGGGGGGGGGSFAFIQGIGTKLVIAGGGGGSGGTGVGGNALTGTSGGIGAFGGGAGGTAGSGGSSDNADPNLGGGGGGVSSAGGSGYYAGSGGGTLPGLAGGTSVVGGSGGFGGGGGAGGFVRPTYADIGGGGGGGGGYSGGGGGFGFHGGGGSFDGGTNQLLVAGFRTGNGEVDITLVPVSAPEPASAVLLGVGLTGLGLIRRRKSAT